MFCTSKRLIINYNIKTFTTTKTSLIKCAISSFKVIRISSNTARAQGFVRVSFIFSSGLGELFSPPVMAIPKSPLSYSL